MKDGNLETKDLMIGDWVLYSVHINGKDNEPYEKKIQISNIYGNEVNCKIEEYSIVSGISLLECRPIPLTPEILEKNGLVNYSSDAGVVRCSENNICIRGWLANCELYIGMIKYVHELQHALRLCGLTYLADSFKV